MSKRAYDGELVRLQQAIERWRAIADGLEAAIGRYPLTREHAQSAIESAGVVAICIARCELLAPKHRKAGEHG